jgi:tRNA(Ile)-lysidine synthase
MHEQEALALDRWIKPGHAVILGLSGGGDSVYLFHALCALRRQQAFPFLAVHIHHGLRGADADADEAFSRTLCENAGVAFLSERVDVRARAKQNGLTLEQAGREARYEVFYREAGKMLEKYPECSAVDILLAHHANDQEETVLMNFLRGSGPAGLGGMRSCTEIFAVDGRPVRLVRPLLLMTHEALLASLRARGLSWREDATNQETDCTRNKLRGKILPEIREVSPAFTQICGREARLFSEINDFLGMQAAQVLEQYMDRQEGSVQMPVKVLGELHPALRHVVVRECIARVGGLKDVGMVHVEAVEQLLEKQSGRSVQLPGGVRVWRSFEMLMFGTEGADRGAGVSGALSEQEFSWRIYNEKGVKFLENLEEIQTCCYTKWFDYDKIKAYCGDGAPVFRTPREGDYLLVNREGQRKPLNLYLKQEKIPLKQRAVLPVVAWGNVILWVPGHRDSACFFVTEKTTQILRLDIGRKEEGEYHGRDFSFDQ